MTSIGFGGVLIGRSAPYQRSGVLPVGPSGVAPYPLGTVLTFPGYSGGPSTIAVQIVMSEGYDRAAPQDLSKAAGAGTPPFIQVYGTVPGINGYSTIRALTWQSTPNDTSGLGSYDAANLYVNAVSPGSLVGDSILRTRYRTAGGVPGGAQWCHRLALIPGLPQPPPNPVTADGPNANSVGYGVPVDKYVWGGYWEYRCRYPNPTPKTKRAPLAWGNSSGRTTATGKYAYGEIDIGELLQLVAGNNPTMWVHQFGQVTGSPDSSNQVGRASTIDPLSDGAWHTYALLWIPGLIGADGITITGGLCRFYVDGVQVGADVLVRVPSGMMRIAEGQVETWLGGGAPDSSVDVEVVHTDHECYGKIIAGLPYP